MALSRRKNGDPIDLEDDVTVTTDSSASMQGDRRKMCLEKGDSDGSEPFVDDSVDGQCGDSFIAPSIVRIDMAMSDPGW